MKKTLVFVVLLLSLFAYKVNAAPNNGPVPENGVKVNFNANGTYQSIEGDGWMIDQQDGSMTLTKGDVVITLNEYVFNDDEIIGFSWMIEGGIAVLWVKHGTTEEVYGDGTSGAFITSDAKQISNVVFLIEIIVDEDDEDDDDDEDDEEVVDEDDDEVLGEEEENDDEDEDEVLGEGEESLPDTSDATAGLGLLSGLFGFMMLFATKKKKQS